MKDNIKREDLIKYIKFLKQGSVNSIIENCFQRYLKYKPLNCDKCPFSSLGFECINKLYIFKIVYSKFPNLLLEETIND